MTVELYIAYFVMVRANINFILYAILHFSVNKLTLLACLDGFELDEKTCF